MTDACGGTPRPRGWIWPVVVIGLLGLNVLVVTVTVIVAGSDPSVAVEPDYYRKALAWDAGRAERRDPGEDGIDVSIQLLPDPDRLNAGQVVVSLSREGTPIEHARIEAEVFHYARSGERQAVRLVEQGAGVYTGRASLRREGNWEVRLRLLTEERVYRFTRQAELSGVAP
ncbi:MAG: hypothetical protein DYG94_08765 [Leptolyngbya sp. PLA3]|nr:MAG: hypothetical protein EDM82_03030 [Cyanobacteria bacterium CYA]MCE7968822.1 hypothetical protein [Leptolyngbya sp. PL-A3]